MLSTTKRLLVGRPLRSERIGQTLLPKRLALPVFCSDPLSSNAYATEERPIRPAQSGRHVDRLLLLDLERARLGMINQRIVAAADAFVVADGLASSFVLRRPISHRLPWVCCVCPRTDLALADLATCCFG